MFPTLHNQSLVQIISATHVSMAMDCEQASFCQRLEFVAYTALCISRLWYRQHLILIHKLPLSKERAHHLRACVCANFKYSHCKIQSCECRLSTVCPLYVQGRGDVRVNLQCTVCQPSNINFTVMYTYICTCTRTYM